MRRRKRPVSPRLRPLGSRTLQATRDHTRDLGKPEVLRENDEDHIRARTNKRIDTGSRRGPAAGTRRAQRYSSGGFHGFVPQPDV